MSLWRPRPPRRKTGEWNYVATYLVTSTPDGVVGEWVDQVPNAGVRATAAGFAARHRGAFPEGRHIESGCTYVRLRVKQVPPDRVEVFGRPLAVDLDFGPSSAPEDYPRVPLVDLFDCAASNA